MRQNQPSANLVKGVVRRSCLLKGVVILFFLGILVVLLPDSARIAQARKAQAQGEARRLATAIIAYEVEYGKLPSAGSGAVEGELLTALMGSNSATNPRGIVFFEVDPSEKGRGGNHNGTFVDPWGGAYQIAFSAGEGVPFRAGTNGVVLKRKKVAVWNDPRLGKEEWSWFSSPRPVPYVTSWD